MKSIDPRHSDPRALGDRRAGGGIPQLAVHEDLAVRTERGPGHADLADHSFLPGRHPRAPRSQHYSSEKYSDDADGDAHRERGAEMHAHLGNWSVDEKETAEHHADDPTDAEDSVRGVLRLECEEDER